MLAVTREGQSANNVEEKIEPNVTDRAALLEQQQKEYRLSKLKTKDGARRANLSNRSHIPLRHYLVVLSRNGRQQRKATPIGRGVAT